MIHIPVNTWLTAHVPLIKACEYDEDMFISSSEPFHGLACSEFIMTGRPAF